MKYFLDLFFKGEQQTEKSPGKSYSVTYTTQDSALEKARKQDLFQTFCSVSCSSSSRKEANKKDRHYISDDEEVGFQCLDFGTSHTYGKVIRSIEPNVTFQLSDNNTPRVTISKAVSYLDHSEKASRLSRVLEVEEGISSIEDDWIVVDALPNVYTAHKSTNSQSLIATKRLQPMALSVTEQNLIKASWVPIRADPVTAGLLLFDGLFTKYPRYLSYFPQFSIELGSMKENKRLTNHAVKVIEKVTYVVDALGNEAMTSQLNEALIKLVRSHIDKKIGLEEFTNLGEVLIDFICFVNYHGLARAYAVSQVKEKPAGGQVIDNTDAANNNYSETMTRTLDKIRASSTTSSSSDDESYLVSVMQSSGGIGSADGGGSGGNINTNDTMTSCAHRFTSDGISRDHNHGIRNPDSVGDLHAHQNNRETRLDFSILVSAWRTLYKGVKDLVRQEEEEANRRDQLPAR